MLRSLLVLALAFGLIGSMGPAARAAPSTGDLREKIDKASDDLADIVEAYNKMNEDLKATKAAKAALTASLQPARDQLAAANKQVGTIAASAYKSGQASAVNAVLGGPGTLLDRLGALEQLSRNQEKQIKNWAGITQKYNEKQAALQKTERTQAAQIRELAARRATIQGDLKDLYELRTDAFGRATESAKRYTGKVPSIPGSSGAVVKYAYGALGIMYQWGADGPNGYDCSGLTSAAWRKAGKSLPHNAAAQFGATTRITRSQLVAGDLVFYRSLKHVGIYVGGGQIIDASRAGQPVKKRSIDIMTPYGYGRVR